MWRRCHSCGWRRCRFIYLRSSSVSTAAAGVRGCFILGFLWPLRQQLPLCYREGNASPLQSRCWCSLGRFLSVRCFATESSLHGGQIRGSLPCSISSFLGPAPRVGSSSLFLPPGCSARISNYLLLWPLRLPWLAWRHGLRFHRPFSDAISPIRGLVQRSTGWGSLRSSSALGWATQHSVIGRIACTGSETFLAYCVLSKNTPRFHNLP